MIKKEIRDHLTKYLEKALDGKDGGAFAHKNGDKLIRKITKAVKIEQKRFEVVNGRGK